jgi:hypothetical protein
MLTDKTTAVLNWLQFSTLLVIGAESAIPAPGSGATKTASVLNAIEAASMLGMMDAPNQSAADWTKLIAAEVTLLNNSGVFTHSTTTALKPGS